MERRDRVLVAKVGAVVFAWALGAPAILADAAAQPNVSVASAVSGASAVARAPVTVVAPLLPAADELRTSAGVAWPELFVPAAPRARASTALVEPRSSVRAAPAPARRAGPGPEAYVRDGIVLASWYGPRFYGRRTACGQTYTPEILGVAHRVLPCGTLITLTSPTGRTVTVPVIDRGPYVAGRALDLSNATRIALACSDLCHVRMVVLR